MYNNLKLSALASMTLTLLWPNSRQTCIFPKICMHEKFILKMTPIVGSAKIPSKKSDLNCCVSNNKSHGFSTLKSG